MLGQFIAFNNPISINGEGDFDFLKHFEPFTFGPFCGFSELTAPPTDDHCIMNFVEDVCTIRSVNLSPPEPIDPTP